MDPREKREDESWAEYGARMAAMGIAPVESPMLAGPMVNRFKPAGSTYTPLQLSTPIRQLQQQNIPQNVVPIRPMDATLAGMATVPVGLNAVASTEVPPGGYFYESQAYPSMQADYAQPVLGEAGMMTGMDVAPDAGGAVGGYPTVDYSQMAQDWADPAMMLAPSVPADPTGGMIDIDALAGMFDVGPMSTALNRSTERVARDYTPLPGMPGMEGSIAGQTSYPQGEPLDERLMTPAQKTRSGMALYPGTGLDQTKEFFRTFELPSFISDVSASTTTGNLAGYGTSPFISTLQHQITPLDIEQPATKYGLPYWDSDPAVQRLVDEDAAIDYDFSAVAPVELDTYGKYRSDTGWHQGDFKGQDSADYKNWVMQKLPSFTKVTPTMERVREQEAIAAGNVAAKTAGGLDKIARDRIANQEAIERKMEEDAARINQKREDAARALEDSRNLARRKEEEEIRKATAWVFEERRLEEAAARTEALAVEKAEAQAARDRVSQAQAIMDKYSGRREPAENYMSAEERVKVAHAQVDTFNEITARATQGAADRASVGIDAGGQVGTGGKYGGGGPF